MIPVREPLAEGVDSRRGWTVVGASFASMFVVFGVAYSFGPFFEPMAEEFGTSPSATSAVFSITAFVYFLLGSISGLAVDRYGPRRVLSIGAVAMGTGLVLTSQVQALWIGYLTYGVGVGVGVACGYVPMVATVSGWFDQRRGAAHGVAVSGIGFGTVITAPLAALLIDRYGWRTTYVIFGLVSSTVLVACALLAQPPPRSTAIASSLGLGRTIRTRRFRMLYLSTFLLSLVLFVPFVFLTLYAEAHGASEVRAASLLAVIGGASIAGRLIVGPIADRVGYLVAFRACFLLIGSSFAIWLASDAFTVLVAFAVMLGIGYGGFVTLSPAVIASLFGTEGLGGLIGFTYTAAAFGGLLGPPITGGVIDATCTHGPSPSAWSSASHRGRRFVVSQPPLHPTPNEPAARAVCPDLASIRGGDRRCWARRPRRLRSDDRAHFDRRPAIPKAGQGARQHHGVCRCRTR